MSNEDLVCQFKISLRGVKPPVWRRIQVPHTYSFWDLHVALQDAMGWFDCHLHVFRVVNPDTGKLEEIGIPNEDLFEDEDPCLPGWELPMSAYLMAPGARADYEYDFGDSWEHEVVLEEVTNRVPGQKYPRCLAGKRACPPEDCRGIGGFQELLEIIRDPSHEEHESMIEWLGGSYDPEAFDANKVSFDNPRKRWELAFGDA